MEANAMLEKISGAIEHLAQQLEGAGAGTAGDRKTKRMSLDAFVSLALKAVEKAAKEPPVEARKRLLGVRRAIMSASEQIAKIAAEDTEGQQVTVEVQTAWAPSGDRTVDGLTTPADQASIETSAERIQQPGGDSNFSENIGEVAKALGELKKKLAELGGGGGRKTTEKGDGIPWPADLNSEDFRKGVSKGQAPPVWGYDPEDSASKEG